jgi:hypothetical protein
MGSELDSKKDLSLVMQKDSSRGSPKVKPKGLPLDLSMVTMKG